MSTAADLTSVVAVKQWLGLISGADDALLGGLVSAVSQAILADLGRPCLLPSVYTDTVNGGGGDAVVLRHWPVTQVMACTVDGVPLSASLAPTQAGFVLDQPDLAPPGTAQGLSYRNGAFPRGRQNVSITYRAGYEIRLEPAIVPAAAPYVVTASVPYGAWACDTGVGGASGAYNVAAGAYTFTSAAAGQAITLSYGFVPGDLQQAANEWIADRYAARMRIGQSAKTLGGQETTSFIVKSIPDAVDRLLRPYRRIAR